VCPNTEIDLRLTRLEAMSGSWPSHVSTTEWDLWMCWKSRLWWAQHASHFAGNQLRPSPSRLKIYWVSDAVRYQKDTSNFMASYCHQPSLDSIKIKSRSPVFYKNFFERNILGCPQLTINCLTCFHQTGSAKWQEGVATIYAPKSWNFVTLKTIRLARVEGDFNLNLLVLKQLPSIWVIFHLSKSIFL